MRHENLSDGSIAFVKETLTVSDVRNLDKIINDSKDGEDDFLKLLPDRLIGDMSKNPEKYKDLKTEDLFKILKDHEIREVSAKIKKQNKIDNFLPCKNLDGKFFMIKKWIAALKFPNSEKEELINDKIIDSLTLDIFEELSTHAFSAEKAYSQKKKNNKSGVDFVTRTSSKRSDVSKTA